MLRRFAFAVVLALFAGATPACSLFTTAPCATDADCGDTHQCGDDGFCARDPSVAAGRLDAGVGADDAGRDVDGGAHDAGGADAGEADDDAGGSDAGRFADAGSDAGADAGFGTQDAGNVVDAGIIDLRGCAQVKVSQPDAGDGVYVIDPDGADGGDAPFATYCDMTNGGWALALKVDGTQATFEYEAAIWTDDTLLASGSTNRDVVEAKLDAYLSHPVDDIKVELAISSPLALSPVPVVVPVPRHDSLRSLIASNVLQQTSLGPGAWRALAQPGAFERNCNREGVNILGTLGWVGARIGFIANDEEECDTTDSVVGVGLHVTNGGCGLSAPYPTAGVVVGCDDALAPADKTSAFATVWVRSTDFTRSVSSATSCAAHLALGRSVSGTYLVADMPRYCDQEHDGGGWMRVVDVQPMLTGDCPSPLRLDVLGDQPQRILCRPPERLTGGAVDSFNASTFGAPATQIRGVARGLQIGTPDGFATAAGQSSATDIEQWYVDGVSITVGTIGAREHVFTYAIGVSQWTAFTSPSYCPCAGGVLSSSVGGDYACESGAPQSASNGTTFDDAPLWDGVAAPPECVAESRDGFVVTSPAVNPAAIEIRTMLDEATSNEDVGLQRFELFVR